MADTKGNLVFRGASRNSNPDVAMSGKQEKPRLLYVIQVNYYILLNKSNIDR
jgi:hypothetical protein